MPKTVVGLFDNRIEARNAVQDLIKAGVKREDIGVMSKELEGKQAVVELVEEDGREQVEDMAKGAGAGAAVGGIAGLLLSFAALAIPGIGPVIAAGPIAALIAGAGIGATAGGLISGLTRLGIPENEAHTYAEGVKRGGTLISVNVSDDLAAQVVTTMKQHGAIEVDKRAAQWREEGWTGFDDKARDAAFDAYQKGAMTLDAASDTETTAEHERIPAQSINANKGEIAVPVIEEQLEVGKREVERGGVRVQTHVTETPVEENVQLRDERVHVERRPVDYTFHGSESEAFQESIVEIKEAYEELIVNKKARVVEEVIVGKDVQQHTETVRDTLRRTDVDIEPLEPESARGANASSQQTGTQNDPVKA